MIKSPTCSAKLLFQIESEDVCRFCRSRIRIDLYRYLHRTDTDRSTWVHRGASSFADLTPSSIDPISFDRHGSRSKDGSLYEYLSRRIGGCERWSKNSFSFSFLSLLLTSLWSLFFLPWCGWPRGYGAWDLGRNKGMGCQHLGRYDLVFFFHAQNTSPFIAGSPREKIEFNQI